MPKLDAFTQSYVACALWRSLDGDCRPLELHYTVDDIAPETLAEMVADCAAFQAQHAADIAGRAIQAGMDFWLTRNRLAVGFWDRGTGFYPTDAVPRLTDGARAFGPYELCLCADGTIRGHGTIRGW